MYAVRAPVGAPGRTEILQRRGADADADADARAILSLGPSPRIVPHLAGAGRSSAPTTPPPRPPARPRARAPARRGSQATSEGFELLFAYISGANARNESIAMTAPVWTAIGPGAGPFCSSTFRVGFSVPASLQAAAPEPSDARVSLTPTGEAFSCVAVRGFGGYANDTSVVAQAAALAAQLASGGWVFDAQSYAVAQYDSPFTAIGRHNEVLIPVAKEACAKAQAQARAQAEQR